VDQKGNPLVGPEWQAIYNGIAGQHAAFENAVRDGLSGGNGWTYAANGQPIVEHGSLANIPKPMQHLLGLMQAAQAATQTYKSTGLFSPAARNRLPAGMADDTVQTVLSNLSANTT